jgi:hypothetical protein
LEKQGANLTKEALLRGISFAAKERNVDKFRNIYVQIDNTGSNKCGTVIVACALLVALGICKKIKVNYLEVGHTHEDIDALIGSVVVKLRAMNLPTLESRIEAIKGALNDANASIKDVQQLMGITDYGKELDSFFSYTSGIMAVKEFRITANEEGIPFFLYKSNSTIDGWYPRPFERTEDFDKLAEVFVHPDEEQGYPIEVISVTPGSSSKSGEKGKRQHWFYKLRFAGGDIMTFPLKCIGIPIKLPDNVQEFAVCLPVQPWSKSKKGGSLTQESHRTALLGQIEKLLQSRDGNVLIFCFACTFSNYLSNVQTWRIFLSGQRSLANWLEELKVNLLLKSLFYRILLRKWGARYKWLWSVKIMYPCMTMTWWRH